jgi:hypothetical protein
LFSVSINLQHERAITLAEVPKHLPKRGGKKVHYSTVYRWVTKGSRGQVLESVMVGGIRYTSIEAVYRFLSAKPIKKTTAARSAAADYDHEIEEALRQAGV